MLLIFLSATANESGWGVNFWPSSSQPEDIALQSSPVTGIPMHSKLGIKVKGSKKTQKNDVKLPKPNQNQRKNSPKRQVVMKLPSELAKIVMNCLKLFKKRTKVFMYDPN